MRGAQDEASGLVIRVAEAASDKLTLKVPCPIDGKFGILTVHTQGGEIVSSDFSEGSIKADATGAAE